MKVFYLLIIGATLGFVTAIIFVGRYQFSLAGPSNIIHLKMDRLTGRTYSRSVFGEGRWKENLNVDSIKRTQPNDDKPSSSVIQSEESRAENKHPIENLSDEELERIIGQ